MGKITLKSGRDALIEKLEKEVKSIKEKILQLKKLGPVKESNKTITVEKNIYKKGKKYKVEIVVNGLLHLQRFNSLEEARKFRDECLKDRLV